MKCIDCNKNIRYDAEAIPCDRQEGINQPYTSGWLCSECQKLECDKCNEKVLDYELNENKIVCLDCLEQEHA
tara:strand:+ start:531 stop:746 length:216 start_codon:yes stop_codon:yes gene_type:complete